MVDTKIAWPSLTTSSEMDSHCGKTRSETPFERAALRRVWHCVRFDPFLGPRPRGSCPRSCRTKHTFHSKWLKDAQQTILFPGSENPDFALRIKNFIRIFTRIWVLSRCEFIQTTSQLIWKASGTFMAPCLWLGVMFRCQNDLKWRGPQIKQ